MTDIWFDSAASLAQKIKARDISARDALEIFLARTERFNGALNAIIWQDNDAARVRADAADAALAAGEYWGPLHGVPVTESATYRITVNSFMASGGDNFSVLNHGTHVQQGISDIDASSAYFKGREIVNVPRLDRITRLN